LVPCTDICRQTLKNIFTRQFVTFFGLGIGFLGAVRKGAGEGQEAGAGTRVGILKTKCYFLGILEARDFR
jgi:hypothetical protein